MMTLTLMAQSERPYELLEWLRHVELELRLGSVKETRSTFSFELRDDSVTAALDASYATARERAGDIR